MGRNPFGGIGGSGPSNGGIGGIGPGGDSPVATPPDDPSKRPIPPSALNPNAPPPMTAPDGSPVPNLADSKNYGNAPVDYEAQVEGVDPRIVNLRNQQINQANDFNYNLSNYKEAQGTQAADNARRTLASDLSGVKSNANRRGLLYSGLNQSAQAGTRAKSAAALGQKQADINTSADQQNAALQNRAIQSGLAIQNLEQRRQDTIAARMAKDQQLRSQNQKDLLGGVGGLIGLFSG